MSTPKPLIDKEESRRIRVQIRHVLLGVWDPIGIRDEPNAQDEYDGYIGELYELITANAPESELIEYLYLAVHDHMGLDMARREDMVATASAIKAIPFGYSA
jgi:hypothetical protein